MRLLEVGLELQQLQLDLQLIVLADRAGLVPDLADVHGLLKALQILLGKFESRFGQLHVDEQSGNTEGEAALVVGNQRASLRGDVLRRLQPVLALSCPVRSGS